MALVLQVMPTNFMSHGVQWAASGFIECDINTGGFRGFLWGVEKDVSAIPINKDYKWVVAQVDDSDLTEVVCAGLGYGGNVCFHKGEVVYCGDYFGATAYIVNNGGFGKPVHKAVVTVGNDGCAVSGNWGVSVSGEKGRSKSDFFGVSFSGVAGSSVSGEAGLSVSGEEGGSVSGDDGISISRKNGTSISGKGGLSFSVHGYVQSGEEGAIQLQYWDGNRRRYKIGYIGEDGLEPNVLYKLDENHEFVKVVEVGL